MDNASIHHGEDVRDAIEAAGQCIPKAVISSTYILFR